MTTNTRAKAGAFIWLKWKNDPDTTECAKSIVDWHNSQKNKENIVVNLPVAIRDEEPKETEINPVNDDGRMLLEDDFSDVVDLPVPMRNELSFVDGDGRVLPEYGVSDDEKSDGEGYYFPEDERYSDQDNGEDGVAVAVPVIYPNDLTAPEKRPSKENVERECLLHLVKNMKRLKRKLKMLIWVKKMIRL